VGRGPSLTRFGHVAVLPQPQTNALFAGSLSAGLIDADPAGVCFYHNRGGFDPGAVLMRRRLEALVPIVLLAVLVQVFAPIAAFRMVANAVVDPLYLASICTDSSDGQVLPSKALHSRGKCCGFCSISHAGAAAVAPPASIFVALQWQFQRILWLQASNPIPTVRVGSNTQARAPPFNS
jgi:Protein of unknown function (DUF2946)